jgi:hypothetical protein
MRKVEKEELFGFWKAIDKENKNEFEILFTDSNKVSYCESLNKGRNCIEKFEIIGEGEDQAILINSKVKIVLPIYQLTPNMDEIMLTVNGNNCWFKKVH